MKEIAKKTVSLEVMTKNDAENRQVEHGSSITRTVHDNYLTPQAVEAD